MSNFRISASTTCPINTFFTIFARNTTQLFSNMFITKESFNILIYQLNARLINYASRFVKDRVLASDMVQDTYVSFWETYNNKQISKPKSLIFSILRNKCIDTLKYMSLFKNQDIYNPLLDSDIEELYYANFISPSSNVDILYIDLEKCIKNSISNLPPKCKEVFTLSRCNFKKNTEIANELGISIKTVEKHITKALKILSKDISNAGYNSNHALTFFII